MNALPTTLKNGEGKIVHLGRELGKGGEGAVFEGREQTDVAIKIYWPDKAASRRDKISAMVAAAWYKSTSFVAFPIDVLYAPNGSFAGFVMKKVGGTKPVHLLYSPASRKQEFTSASFRFLIRAAVNAAKAVASVHAFDCVIGDVNHSGFLVSNQATITLIDSDSFQVIASGKSFLCQVATPEFTPPELQGSKLDRTTRTRNHDNFGLAILIFQLLFMGRHPYSGRYLGSGEMPLDKAISEHRFAYSARSNVTRMQPPPNVPLLSDFPAYISTAFEKAFGLDGIKERPAADAWISLLQRLETELQTCAANSAHHHVKGKPCPWCRMEQGNPGFLAFSSGLPIYVLPLFIDTSQVVALIRSVKDPGAAPDVTSIITAVPIQSGTGATAGTVSILRKQYGAAIGASIVGLLILQSGVSAPLGLVLAGAGLLVSLYPRAEAKKIIEARRQADSAWRMAKDAWNRQAGNQRYLEFRRESESLVQGLSTLPAEEKRGLQQLEVKKRELQLHRYLDRFAIKPAKINKIGSGRKAILASFGIETAADIQKSQLENIQGFGPALITELLNWRRAIEQRFVFNANEPIAAADIAALKATLANKKNEFERKLRSAVSNLQQASNYAFDQRKSLATAANIAFARSKQLEADEKTIYPVLGKVAKIVSAVSLVIALANFSNSKSNTTASVSPPISRPSAPPVTTQPPSRSPSYVPPVQAPSASVGPAIQTPQQRPDTNMESTPVPKVVSRPNNQVDRAPPPPSKEAPAPPGPRIEWAGPSLSPLTNSLPRRDMNRFGEAADIQQRLHQLGYLQGSVDGRWGAQSKRALQEFRIANSLGNDDQWDKVTEDRLFSEDAKRAPTVTAPVPALATAPVAARPPAFIGGWTDEPGSCESDQGGPPLRISASRAVTSAGRCEFQSVQPESETIWRISARCILNDQSWTAKIQMSVSNDRLIWSSERGRQQYYRCRN